MQPIVYCETDDDHSHFNIFLCLLNTRKLSRLSSRPISGHRGERVKFKRWHNSSGGARSLFLPGAQVGHHNFYDGLDPSNGVLAPRARRGMGTGWSSTLPQRESVGVTPEFFFEKLLSKSCFSCAVSAKTLASVGVKYGTMKRGQLVRHNRMKWRRLACWGPGAQRFTAGTEALSGRPLAPLMRNNDWDTNYDASTLDSTTTLWRTKSSATQRPVMLSGTAWWERMDSVAA